MAESSKTVPNTDAAAAARKRRRRRFDCAVLAAVGLYLGLLHEPRPLFAHTRRAGPFDIYSEHPASSELDSRLDAARLRIEKSPLYRSGTRFKLAFADTAWRRRLLSPLAGGAFGSTLAASGLIVLNRAEPGRDVIVNDRTDYARRSLTEVIAHECTHRLLRDRLGVLGSQLLPTWIAEGYCDYVAGGTTIPREVGEPALISLSAGDQPAWRYFASWFAVRHLLEVEHYTVKELLRCRLTFNQALSAAMNRARRRRRGPGGALPGNAP